MTQENKEGKTVQEETAAQESETAKASEKDASKELKKEMKKEEKELKKEKDRIEDLEKQVKDLSDKVAKEKDDYIRLMAEFDNFRRRTSQEKLDLVSVASEDTIKGLLPILDDCERAIAALKDSTDSTAAKEGTELIYNKLTVYLKGKGLSPIEAKGQVFDTDVHEAVAQMPVQEDDKKGKVFDVVQTGYTLNGKGIRFAKVVVGI